jgi:hypothetical protein
MLTHISVCIATGWLARDRFAAEVRGFSLHSVLKMPAVAYMVMRYATSWKVAGSSFNEVTIFSMYLALPAAI